MASTRYRLQLELVLRRLKWVPAWALLSLVMNGVLFITVLVQLLRPPLRLSEPGPLPQANAFAADGQPGPLAAAPLAPEPAELGERQYLDYQQWVALLGREADAIATAAPPNQKILLGDSISLWFPQRLLPGHNTWINQAISGEKSSGLRQRLSLLDGTQPDTVFVMIGINDLIWGESDQEVIDNIEAIVQYLRRQHPDAQVVVQSILPHGGAAASWEGRDRLQQLPPERIQGINGQLRELTLANGGQFLNLYPLFADGEGYLRPDLSTDGLHLNDSGYLVWRSALVLFMQSELAS